MATTYDPKALLNDLIAELTLSILSLELQIEVSLKEDPTVIPILKSVANVHISARDVTIRALNHLETI
jgi:hypothetical protein